MYVHVYICMYNIEKYKSKNKRKRKIKGYVYFVCHNISVDINLIII